MKTDKKTRCFRASSSHRCPVLAYEQGRNGRHEYIIDKGPINEEAHISDCRLHNTMHEKKKKKRHNELKQLVLSICLFVCIVQGWGKGELTLGTE